MWADETAHIRRTQTPRSPLPELSLPRPISRLNPGRKREFQITCLRMLRCPQALPPQPPPTPSLKSLFPPGSVKAHVTKTRESSIRWLDNTNWRFLITINCDKNWFVSPHADQWEGMHTYWFVTVITNRVAGLIFPRQYSWTCLCRNGS